MDIWDLPGPSVFVADIEAVIREGASVIIGFPLGAPEGLERHLRQRLNSLLDWTRLDHSQTDTDLIGSLTREICPDASATAVTRAWDLARQPEFQGRLLWMECADVDLWRQWTPALRALSDASREVELPERTSFVIILCGAALEAPPVQEAALLRLDFRGVVDPLDLFVAALKELPRNGIHERHRALFAQVVAGISQWDSILAERLIEAQLEEVLEPASLLEEYAAERGWSPAMPRSWEAGTVDGGPNRPIVHSALLHVADDRQTLRRRLWAAQAAVLLPGIEERRIALVNEYRRRIPLPVETDEGFISDPLQLSIGQLAWLLDKDGQPWHLRKSIRRLRQARNALAHMEPLGPREALHKALLGHT